ncbi:AMP-binding enzyme, partial [Caldisphaera sp.]
DKTIEAFKGLWFHTGDLGVFDENGYLYFVDRAKDAIRKKGENISSYEIEQTLLKFDKIKEAAVIPVPSEIGEDEVMAVISLKEKVNPEEIIDFCLENMPKFWVPRYIRFVDSLPRTPTGRIEKYKLRNQGITNDTVDMNLYIKQKLQSTRR